MRDHFETVDIELVVNYTFKLQLYGIGISVVNSRSQVTKEGGQNLLHELTRVRKLLL